MEANFLISLLMNQGKTLAMDKANHVSLTWENFKKLAQNAHVIITNSPDRITQMSNFAFAFQWVGEAIYSMENSHEKLEFLVYPTLSYISSDLLAELNTNEATNCVALALSSKKFLTELQNKNHYFSPYMNASDVKNPHFRLIYEQAIRQLPKLPRIISVSMSDFESIKDSWEYIKYNLTRK